MYLSNTRRIYKHQIYLESHRLIFPVWQIRISTFQFVNNYAGIFLQSEYFYSFLNSALTIDWNQIIQIEFDIIFIEGLNKDIKIVIPSGKFYICVIYHRH